MSLCDVELSKMSWIDFSDSVRYLGSVQILRNQLFPNSRPPPPLRNQDNHVPTPQSMVQERSRHGQGKVKATQALISNKGGDFEVVLGV